MNALARESRISQISNPVTSVDETGVSKSLRRTLLMDRLVSFLIEKSQAELLWPDFYQYAVGILKTLGLSSENEKLASHRLRNAMDYAIVGEYGASTFELRMLRSQLA